MSLRFPLIFFTTLIGMVCLSLFTFCGTEQKEKGDQQTGKQLSLTKNTLELISDTLQINPLIDSLRSAFFTLGEADQALLLGELAENWRPYTYELAAEEYAQSKKIGFITGEGDALCKKGIYFCRSFQFDSATYFLNEAENLGEKNKLPGIVAQSLSWQGELLRLSGEYNSSLETQNKAISIASTVNDKKRLSFCNISKGESSKLKSEFDSALVFYSRAIDFANAIGDKNKLAICYNSIGDVYRIQNNYPLALSYFNKGMSLAKTNKNKQQEAFCLSGIGDIYSTQQEFDKALDYYKKAHAIASELGIKLQECNSLSSIGLNYYLLNKTEEALNYFDQAIKIAEEIGNKDKQAFVYNLIGDIYYQNKNNEKAFENYNTSIKIATEIGNKIQLANTYNRLGLFHYHTSAFAKANEALLNSLKFSKDVGNQEGIKNASSSLAALFEAQGNYKKALEFRDAYYAMRDSIRNEENIKQLAAAEYKAKEEGLKAEQNAKERTFKAEAKQKEIELNRQKTIRYAFTIGFVLVLLLVGVVFRSLQQNKKKNKIITAQKQEVEHQKELVEEKNKEITDSITYAKRLQDAILPPLKLVQQHFPESFILYKPKDIIAGDFYWMEKAGDLIFFAAADSTGHGVPGAMVSVVCSNALNRAIKEFKLSDTGKILDKTRELVLETFEKSEGDVKDGMDVSLISMNLKTKEIYWSGANNPLWYLGSNGIQELKANKQPIGKTENPLPFTTHKIDFQPGTIFYLITDGYADQFGGPKGKKYKYKQLQELFILHSGKTMDQQQQLLDRTFEEWRGELDQVDDVTIVGIKI